MFRLPVRRGSLCLFCACTAHHPPRLAAAVPRIQAACRSTKSSGKASPPSLYVKIREKFDSARKSNKRLKPKSFLYSRVGRRLDELKPKLHDLLVRDSPDISEETFEAAWDAFQQATENWIERGPPELHTLVHQDAAYQPTLVRRLRYRFYDQLFSGHLTTAEIANQKKCADLRFPPEWYPATREMQRTIHLHVGPTNSGKTYHALKRLEEARRGIYLGPLRLLAHEIYTRLNAKGRACALVTGEEQRMPCDSPPAMFSCTVEMAPLNTRFDVAVIDEIQMISNPERGWAWSQAFLGIQAREIHLCGEARTVAIIRQLAGLTGDKVVIHSYERLTPLQVQSESLRSDLSQLEKGDCVVAFGIPQIHALRRQIETRTNKRCAIVYGSLPPETRAQQARLFNDPNNDYDYLVASDAIGMGLNLAVKRIIFESVEKNNGLNYGHLPLSDLKQIAGRAGRFKTAHEATTADAVAADPIVDIDDVKEVAPVAQKTVGWVTTYKQKDFDYLRFSMPKELEDIETARIFPPSLIVERFASYFPPGTPFSYILLRLHNISQVHPRFELCELREQLGIADLIHSIKNLSIQERTVICATPINVRDTIQCEFLRSLSEYIAQNRTATLLELELLPLEYMDCPSVIDRRYIYLLERLHKMLIAYIWLSFRFPHIFVSRQLANYCKKLVEDEIEYALDKVSVLNSDGGVSAHKSAVEIAGTNESGEAEMRSVDPEEVLM